MKKTAEEIYRFLEVSFLLERNQGLDYEVRAILPHGWTVELRSDGYVFSGPWSSEWESTVWSMVRFLAYDSFLSFRKKGMDESMSYELLSVMKDGCGFRAIFQVTPNEQAR